MWGEGVAFVDGLESFETQEILFNFGVESLEAAKGDGGGKIREVTQQLLTGRMGFLGMNPDLFGALTGATNAAGTLKRVRNESVTKSTNSLTLAQTNVNDKSLRVVPTGANKQPLSKVASSPAVGEYSISGNVLTLNASQTETIFTISYIYTDSSNGIASTVAPGDVPDSFELLSTIRNREQYSDVKGDIIVHALKCVRTSEFGLGASNGQISKPGFDFEIRNDASGDFKVYWP